MGDTGVVKVEGVGVGDTAAAKAAASNECFMMLIEGGGCGGLMLVSYFRRERDGSS